MCGIAGLVDPSAPAMERERVVAAMCGRMTHRGPDDAGLESSGPASIGMRRLAIFDPANGHQPMTTPDGRHSIVFNGAIYNFHELRAELESAGSVFRTQCDTEILLGALAQWGPSALGRLRGMFAFALWDRGDESLLVARDPFGIKPLYYIHDGGRLAFASEITALLASCAGAPGIDPASVAEYLAWFAVPAPRTIYRGIMSLMPGQSLVFRRGRLDLQTFWSFSTAPRGDAPCSTREEFVRGLRGHLEDSIRVHLLADVPVGAFLSGGVDSAVVAGLMSRATGSALRTFSIGFEEDGYSEADDAEASARHFGAVHHTRIVTGDEVAGDMDAIISACDQPTGDGVNTYYASQTAQQGGVKVALSGLGGDELLGGYPSFQTLPILASLLPALRAAPGGLRALVARALGAGGTRSRKLADFVRHARDPHELGALSRRVFPVAGQRAMLAPGVLGAMRDSPFHPSLDAIRSDLGGAELYSVISAWEMRTYMADVLLRDSDVMSMRHSLELRVPFVDRPLAEWIARQPARLKDDRRRPKSALADATADILPPGLLARRKRGFTLPFPVWMRGSLRPFIEDTFSAASVARSGLFAPGPVQGLWSRFAAGGDDRAWSRVWSLAVLIAFINRRGPGPAPAG